MPITIKNLGCTNYFDTWQNMKDFIGQSPIKDELWTCGFILLIAACMWPDAQPYIKEGFRVLKDDCPEWLS